VNGAAAYFERPIPIALVLGIFAFGVVPLALLQLVPNFVGVVPHLMLLCAVGLGTSHFFLTLAIYFSRSHLQYFRSSLQRALIYFGLPILIFGFLAWIASSGVRDTHPHEVAYLFAFVRMLDFFHVGRQSFGMLQLWKRPLRDVPAWTRGAENTFFVGAAAMQWQSFWVGGQFPGERIEGLLPAAALGVLFVSIASVYARLVAAGGGRAAKLAFAYFVVQAICSAAAIYRTWLYLTVLAVHYLEYHVIMYPRCFSPEPEAAAAATSRRAHWLDWLRTRPLVFYALLVPLLIAFQLRNSIQPGSRPLTFLIHVFDGIFVVHYVMDAFLWRFGNPFYRQLLGPLYFGAATSSATGSATSGSEPNSAATSTLQRSTRHQTWAFGAAKLGLALLAIIMVPVLSPGAGTLAASVIDPIHAKNHLRWGIELAQRGDFIAAKQHLTEAMKRDPAGADAPAALRWVQARESPFAVDRSHPQPQSVPSQ
jgi:hypothetical protein